jgi:hypothetical protein
MRWAWERLMDSGAATPEFAAGIASRLTREGDKMRFGGIAGQKRMLTEWCQDPVFLTRVPSADLMLAAQQIGVGGRLPDAEEVRAIENLAAEMARRLEMPLAQVINQGRPFSLLLETRRIQRREGASVSPLPHPLFGLAVCPSVERYRILAEAWRHGGQRRPFLDSPLAVTLQLLAGWVDNNGRWIQEPGWLEQVADFPTAHPLKRQVRRWGELTRQRELPALNPEMEDPSWGGLRREAGILGLMAKEEQTEMEWHLLYTVLASSPAAGRFSPGMVLGEIFRERSPLTAGFGISLPEVPPTADSPKMAGPRPDEIAGIFLGIIGSEAGRQALSPGGAGAAFLEPYSTNAFSRAVHALNRENRAAVTELLMQAEDPLAARMAIALTVQSSGGPEDVLRRARERFPEDPEIALAAISHDFPSKAERGNAFRGALPRLSGLFENLAETTWCGIPDASAGKDVASVEAILDFAVRTRPGYLPRGWLDAVRSGMADPEVLRQMRNRSGAVALLQRYDSFSTTGWLRVLSALKSCGEVALARQAAASVLEQGNVWLNERATGINPASPGWRLLQIAAGSDPEILATRLQKAAAGAPRDAALALSALLAQSFCRPLTSNDSAPLARLSWQERMWILGCASQLLTPDRLPPSLCREAWEAQAWKAFTEARPGDSGHLKWGLRHLERLSSGGVTEAIPQLVELLLGHLNDHPWLMEDSLSEILTSLRGLRITAGQELPDGLMERLMDRLSGTAPSHGCLAVLLQVCQLFSPGKAPPAMLEQRTTNALEAALELSNAEAAQDRNLLRLAVLTLPHPPWREKLRQLAARRNQGDLFSTGWATLAEILQTFETGMTVPDLELRFMPTAEGSGRLQWTMQGILASPRGELSSQHSLYREVPVGDLAGKFDAAILVEDETAGDSRIAARIGTLPAAGEIALSGLPAAGRLKVRLSGREGTQPTGETRRISFNTLPVILDTAQSSGWTGVLVPGWHLLSPPVPMAGSKSWDVRTAGDTLPPGLALLLLDEQGNHCSTGYLRSSSGRDVLPGTPPAGVIHQWQTNPFPEPPAGSSNGRIQMAGPATHLVLAIPAHSQPALMPRLTVQLWPEFRKREITGQFEVLRQWAMPFKLENPPLIRSAPLQAVFIHQNQLWILNLETSQPPRILDFPAENLHALQVFETGALLHVLFKARVEEGSGQPVSSLLSFDPTQPGPLPARHLFSGRVSALGPSEVGIPGVVLFHNNGQLDSLLTAENRMFRIGSLPSLPARLDFIRAHSSTGLECQQSGKAGSSLLTWTNGTLELIHPMPASDGLLRTNPSEAAWYVGQDGVATQPTASPPQAWQLPCNLRQVRIISNGRAILIGANGLSLVRMVHNENSRPAQNKR